MKNYLFGIIAIVLAIGFSAFKMPVKGKKFTNTIYRYDGTQSEVERKKAANYTKVASISCSGTDNECAVTLNADFGTHPDFTNVSFAMTTGFPNGGTAWVSNSQKN